MEGSEQVTCQHDKKQLAEHDDQAANPRLLQVSGRGCAVTVAGHGTNRPEEPIRPNLPADIGGYSGGRLHFLALWCTAL